MSQIITAGLAQRVPLPVENSLQPFADDVAKTLQKHDDLQMLIYPEMHLHGTEHLPEQERSTALEDAAVSLDDPFCVSARCHCRQTPNLAVPR
ncbi:hypothetical protein [Glutamicibacter sp. AOP5-A2-18]|uniref:hypothetical protein n=1 Tax=Glutamicibacter sp. AOP5-A2-18 TaxID=3457656 RepID=UPI004034972E